MISPQVTPFFDKKTKTFSYVVTDPNSRRCAVIDPVLDFDPSSGGTTHVSSDVIVDYILDHSLDNQWILETHAHADHLSAAVYLQDHVGGEIVIGENITEVQRIFGRLFNVEEGFSINGSQFDRLLADGDQLIIGSLSLTAIHTPGHTPACMTYVIGDAAFIGDTLFMPDYGSARCDFPGGDAATLFRSVQKLYKLPDDTRVFVCHDYLPKGRSEYVWETSIGEQKSQNIHINAKTSEKEFVEMREARDKNLPVPKLIIPSIQVNIRAGHFPPPEDNGIQYIKVPLNKFGGRKHA